jgi:hypothetical protein
LGIDTAVGKNMDVIQNFVIYLEQKIDAVHQQGE